MATKKVTTIASEVDRKAATFIKARDADRKAAKALLCNFLKIAIHGFADDPKTMALHLVAPNMRSAMIEFYIRHIYGKPTRKSSKSRKAAQANIGAEVRR